VSGPRVRQAGFTLLEVLVALAILSLAVVASIQGFAQGLRLLKLSGDHQQAMLLADQKAREIVVPREGHEEGTEGPFLWERTTKVLEAPDLAPNGTLPLWRVYEIDVRVNWDTRRQVEVRTLRTTPMSAELTAGAAAAAAQAPPGTSSIKSSPSGPRP
jgi:type II secretion system protein I